MPSDNQYLTRRVIGFVTTIVISVLAVYIYRYFLSFHKVIFDPKYGTKIAIGTTNGNTDEGLKIDNVIANSDDGDLVRIKDGSYVLHFYGGDFQEQYQQITVSKNITVTTPYLSFSPAKLTKTLSTERPLISRTVSQTLDLNKYTLSFEALYKQADWYAAIYAAKNTDADDMQRIILHKVNGNWVIAGFPSVVFYVADLPNVPEDIVRDINNR